MSLRVQVLVFFMVLIYPNCVRVARVPCTFFVRLSRATRGRLVLRW